MGRTKSLKWQLLIGNTLIFNLLLLCFSVFIYWFSYQSMQFELDKDLDHLRNTMNQTLNYTLDMPIEMLKELQQYYQSQNAINGDSKWDSNADVLATTVQMMIAMFPLIEEVKVINQDAEIQGIYPNQANAIGQSVIYEDFYIDRPLNDDIKWSGVYRNVKNGQPTVTYSALCGNVLVVVDLNLNQLNALFNQDTFDVDTDLVLLDQYGNYIFDVTGEKTSQNARYENFDKIKTIKDIDKKFHESPNDKKRLIAMFSTSDLNQWYIVLSQDKSSVYATLTQLTRTLILSTILTSFCSILFLYLNLQSAVKDINGLILSTQELAQGNYFLVLPQSSFTEIHELTDHFAMMAEQIESREEEVHALNEELEAMVQELEITNEALEEGAKIAQDATLSKTQFLANMSHEIRTPMNGMMGMMALLEMTMLDEGQKSYLKTMHASAESLLVILNDILDFSKIEAGKVALSVATFNLKSLIEDLEVLFKASAHHKGISLTVEWGSDLPLHYIGDSNRLRQILANIIGNAVKFTSKGAVNVTVKGNLAAENMMQLYFLVSDTGLGIAHEDQLTLFERFTQGNQKIGSQSTLHSSNKGTGLGLAISQMLLNLMDGKIILDSEIGKGSTFTVALALEMPLEIDPLVETDVIRPTKIQQLASQETLANMEILVVEDDPTSAFLLKKFLGKYGGNITHVTNGRLAVDEISQNQYDVVLMDVNMPVMDGITAVKLIREKDTRNRLGTAMPVIAMTAYAMDSDVVRCMQAGMSDYLSKPINLERLLEKVTTISNAVNQADFKHAIDESHLKSDMVSVHESELLNAEKSSYQEVFGDFKTASDLDDESCHFLLSVYVEQVQIMVTDIRSAMAINAQDTISALLHRLKGTSGNVRANRIMTLALVAENAQRLEDMAMLELQITEVESAISHLKRGVVS